MNHEGEHKICQYIRMNPIHKNETTVIYGLDADLIMLAINHLPLCNQIICFINTISLKVLIPTLNQTTTI